MNGRRRWCFRNSRRCPRSPRPWRHTVLSVPSVAPLWSIRQASIHQASKLLAVEPSNVIRLAANAQRWRMIATATSAIAAALVVMIGVGVRAGPASRQPAAEAKDASGGGQTATPAPHHRDNMWPCYRRTRGGPAFILTVDAATRNFTVRKVGAAAEPGSSFELWLISDKLPKPRSLGVIGGSDFTSRPVLASYDADIVRAATYAVTVEQAGGSPDGNPHSAPIFHRQADRDGPAGPLSGCLSSLPARGKESTSQVDGAFVRWLNIFQAIPQKENARGERAFSWGQLGGTVGSSIIHTVLWGAGKAPREFAKLYLSHHHCVRTRYHNRLACLDDTRGLRRAVIRERASRNSKTCHRDAGDQRQHHDLEVRRAISAVNRVVHHKPPAACPFCRIRRRDPPSGSSPCVKKRRNGAVVSLGAITKQ